MHVTGYPLQVLWKGISHKHQAGNSPSGMRDRELMAVSRTRQETRESLTWPSTAQQHAQRGKLPTLMGITDQERQSTGAAHPWL